MRDVQILELEAELQSLSEELTAPARRECLSCYLVRMLTAVSCNSSHRFTRRWARSRRRGTEDGLERWAAASGGCCCDCEVIINSLHSASAGRRGGVECTVASAWRDACAAGTTEAGPPPCAGVPG